MQTTLLSLPRELRDQIYTLVLADLVLEPLYIRKFDSDLKWKLCYNPRARLPGISLVSKAISLDIKGLYFALRGPQRIIIDYWCGYASWKPSQLGPEELEAERGFRVTSVENILSFLNVVQELNLEIDALWIDSDCLPLVRWIRAVLNQRHNRLRKLAIGVHCNDDASCSSDRRDIIREAREIRTHMQPPGDVWILRRTRRTCAHGPSRGDLLRGIQAPEERRLPQTMAWRDLCYGEKRRWVVWLWCVVCDSLDIFRNHDTWFGTFAGTSRCCIFCAVLHLCHYFNARSATFGWPSTKAQLRLKELLNVDRQGPEEKLGLLERIPRSIPQTNCRGKKHEIYSYLRDARRARQIEGCCVLYTQREENVDVVVR